MNTTLRQPDGSYRIPSRTEPGKIYSVTLWPAATCGCWAHRTKHAAQPCPHIVIALEHDHTYQNRLANLGAAPEPDHLHHTIALNEANQAIL